MLAGNGGKETVRTTLVAFCSNDTVALVVLEMFETWTLTLGTMLWLTLRGVLELTSKPDTPAMLTLTFAAAARLTIEKILSR